MGYGVKIAALALSVGFGTMLVPGCVIQIGPGGSGDTSGQGATTGAGVGGAGGSGNAPGSGGGADAFAGIDPQVLALESLKASALGYDVYGLVNSSGIDPNTIDQATIDGLVQQFAPTAEATVNDWLATIDPSTIPTAGNDPKWECTEQHKCPYATKCSNAPYNALKHTCWVNTCGSSKCSVCPGWFPDWLKAPIYKSWCAYVCTDQSYPPKIVAIGATMVDHWDNPHPQDGPYCFAP